MKNKKKQKGSSMIYVYIGIVALLLVGIFSMGLLEKDNPLYEKKANDLNPATRQLLSDENYQNIILPAALDEKVANKEDFVVYMFAANCQYCKATTPQIMPIVNEVGLDLLQFNLLEFDTYFNKYKVEYTPTILAFEDGVEVERLVGGVTAQPSANGVTLEQFREFFEKYSNKKE